MHEAVNGPREHDHALSECVDRVCEDLNGDALSTRATVLQSRPETWCSVERMRQAISDFLLDRSWRRHPGAA